MGIDTITLGLVFTILGIGVFLSFRILNITDLTIEASFGFGAIICALLCDKGMNFWAFVCAFLGGAFAGLITALLHTKLKINAILSGILTLTAFISINIVVSGDKAAFGLRKYVAGKLADKTIMPNSDIKQFFLMLAIDAVIIVLTILFFKTKLGMSIRACGDNEQMTKAQCISTDLMKIIGLALSNGLVALSAAFFIQFNGAYSAGLEAGMMVVGVATIIIGEFLVFKKHQLWLMLLGIMGGSIIYRIVFALILEAPSIEPKHYQLIQAIMLVAIISLGIGADKLSNYLKLRKAKKAVDLAEKEVEVDA